MSIVRCEICGFTADLDYVDMVDMPGMEGFAHPDCLIPDTEQSKLDKANYTIHLSQAS